MTDLLSAGDWALVGCCFEWEEMGMGIEMGTRR